MANHGLPHENRPRSSEELIQIHADTLFLSDATGRLRFNADPGYPEAELEPAPRFWLGRTQRGATWRLRVDLPADLALTLDGIAQTIAPASDPRILPAQANAIREALQTHAPITGEWAGPAYWVPDPPSVPPAAVVITPDTADLLAPHFPWKQTPRALRAAGPLVATIVGGRAVAICYCARLTAVAAEAGVATTESARGHGYGQAAVAGWAIALQRQGILPMYSTSWDNHASQGIARRLAMIPYADTWAIL